LLASDEATRERIEHRMGIRRAGLGLGLGLDLGRRVDSRGDGDQGSEVAHV
jgi:hypothetical protein